MARKSRSGKTANTRAGNSRKGHVSRKAEAVANKARKAAEAEERKRALEEIYTRWDPHVRVAAAYDFAGNDETRYLRNEFAIRDEAQTFENEGIGPADDTQYLLCKYGLPEGPLQSCIAIGEILLPSESPVRPNRLRYYNMDCRGIPGSCGNHVCPRAKPQFRQPLLEKIRPKFRELRIIKPDQALLWKGRGTGIENVCTFPEDPNCPACNACRTIINGDVNGAAARNSAPKGKQSQVSGASEQPKHSRQERRLKWLAEAMLLVDKHPDWPDAEIARKVGKNPSQLSRSREYQAAAGIARGDKSELRKGHIVVPNDRHAPRDVEAVDPDSDV